MIIANQQLLTKYEAVILSQSSDSSYANERCAFIPDIEEEVFNSCIGLDGYYAMIGDMVQYYIEGTPSAVGTMVKIFRLKDSSGTVVTFSEGDYVRHKNKTYEVIQDTTGTQEPPNSLYFYPARKFTSNEFEFIWNRYLGKILAMSVMYSSVMYRLIQDTGKGLVKNFDSGKSESATLKEVYALKKEAQQDVTRTMQNMIKYIQSNPNGFDTFNLITNTGCNESCATKSKRVLTFNRSVR